MKTRVGMSFSFAAAHFLPGHRKCGVIHGHNYRVVIEVSRNLLYLAQMEGIIETLDEAMVIDFAILKGMIEHYILAEYDHVDLNIFMEYPTAERIAQNLFMLLRELLLTKTDKVLLESVTVWETDDSYAKIVASDNE